VKQKPSTKAQQNEQLN